MLCALIYLYFCWQKAKMLLFGCIIRFVFAAPEASALPSQREEFAGTGSGTILLFTHMRDLWLNSRL
jgi:hypothetical protein